MRISIYQPDSSGTPKDPIDATRYLLEDEEPSFNQELERAKWEWVVDDFTLTLSDKDRVFTNAFAGITKQSRWWIDLYGDPWSGAIQGATPSSRLLFRGMIEVPTIKFLPLQKTVTFTAYTLQRYLWDRLENIKAKRVLDPKEYMLHLGLQDFLTRELVAHQVQADGLFSTIDLGEFATRKIRDSLIVTGPVSFFTGSGTRTVDASKMNDGMFRFIDPNMLWSDLLQQMSMYYNAAFYIEPETRKLMMRKRTAAATTDIRIIDDMISEKADLEVRPVDDAQLDYAGLYMEFTMPPPSLVAVQMAANMFQDIWVPSGTVMYKVTAAINSKDLFQSEKLELNLPNVGLHAWRYALTIKIPAGPAGTEQRIVYRYHTTQSELGYRAIAVIPGNTVEDYVDRAPLVGVASRELPDLYGMVKVWMRYTPAGGWDPPILDGNGNLTPPGTVQDITPKIQFTDHMDEGSVNELDGQSVFEFFGSEMSPTQFHEQFLDLFLTKRRVLGRLKGTDYRLGDRVQFKRVSGLQGVELLVRKAKNLFYQRETEVELLEL